MKPPLKLRDKMTLWYTGLTFLTLALFSGLLYVSVQHVLEQRLQQDAQLALRQLVAQIETHDGKVVFENEVPVSADTMFLITEENGEKLASYGTEIALFDTVAAHPGEARHVYRGNKSWLVLDSTVVTVAHSSYLVRVAVSAMTNQQVLATLRLILLIGLPIVLGIALMVGRLIAQKSLQPIRSIINSANQIAQGELSARIPTSKIRDELGELTETLNQMLQNVEQSFAREKRFTSDASHELRMPVAVILAYAENLRSKLQDDADLQAEVDIILSECHRMQKIITQLLTITRGQEGRLAVMMEAVDIREVVQSVAEIITDSVVQSDMRLSMTWNGDLRVEADQTLITELFLNLLENAVKYGKPGGEITVSAESVADGVAVQVADTGIGIPEEALPHIFDRFYRVDAARDRTGSGLGLSIAAWIIQMHHGEICVQSTLGKGSTFTVILPKKQPAAQTEKAHFQCPVVDASVNTDPAKG